VAPFFRSPLACGQARPQYQNPLGDGDVVDQVLRIGNPGDTAPVGNGVSE
jgi:putative component of toxin-antitoxin plasmid stabilization module